MNALDVALVLLAAFAAVGGWRLGLITRALSWAGMALGIVVSARVLPTIVSSADDGTHQGELVVLAVGLFMLGAFLGQALGLVAGNRLNLGVTGQRARTVDSAGGAAAGLVGIIVAVWLLAPAVADAPGWPSHQVRRSRLVHLVTDVLPAPPATTATLQHLLGEQYPQVFDALRPTPALGDPPAGSDIADAVSRRITRSTVKVFGQACARIQEGSGWVAGPDLIVTNAHVVAGEQSVVLERSDGRQVPGTVVAFDPARDLAVVRAPGFDRPALVLSGVTDGERGAVYGHPDGGPLRIAPFRLSQQIVALGTDIYQRHQTRRDVLIIAAQLAPGDSGSALVLPSGRVAGVAFAIAPDRGGVAYALAPDEVTPVLHAAEHATRSAATGACLTS